MLTKRFYVVLLIIFALQNNNFLFAQEADTVSAASKHLQNFQDALTNKNYTEAIAQYNAATILDSNEAKPYLVKYATALAAMGEYNKVYALLLPHMLADDLPKYLKEKANNLYLISSYARRNTISTDIKITNAGDSINSPAEEYFPSINFQDSLFVFMRRPDWQREDYFTSVLTSNGFTEAQLLKDSLNSTAKKGSASFTKDMQTMYFAAEFNGKGFGRYDIYRAYKTPTGWSNPINLGRNINTDFWESAPSISIDGNALYFMSNRPDGYGGIDIYVSYKNEEGFWDEAINMGPNINTAGDEQTPFIHADNKTLYFSSTGWPGYGGADLFVSKFENGKWQQPTNLGYPINTFDNEGSITVTTGGTEAYIASDRPDSRGGLDIYKIILAKNTRANWKDSIPSPAPKIPTPVIAIVPNKPQVFNNLLFAVNAATLINKEAPELLQLIQYLQVNKKATIVIEGHTDNSGSTAANLTLSSARAASIQQILIDKGIESTRIKSIGYGETKPIADNKTEQGRATNRRTSFTVIVPENK